jgi:hypothetical protein
VSISAICSSITHNDFAIHPFLSIKNEEEFSRFFVSLFFDESVLSILDGQRDFSHYDIV